MGSLSSSSPRASPRRRRRMRILLGEIWTDGKYEDNRIYRSATTSDTLMRCPLAAGTGFWGKCPFGKCQVMDDNYILIECTNALITSNWFGCVRGIAISVL